MPSSRRNITRFALAVLGLCVALTGCSRTPSVGGSTSNKAGKARHEAEQLVVNATIACALAQAETLPDGGQEIATKHALERSKVPTPKSTPRPGSPAVIRERIKSTVPHLTEAEAEEDALGQAQLIVKQKLEALDPPLQHKPSRAEVRAEYLRKESRAISQPSPEVKDEMKDILAQTDMTGSLVYVEYDVEVSADQVRELRAQERVSSSLRIVGALFAVALAGFLFLRADEWTKGYLTRWLAFAAVTVAGGSAAALIFI